MKALKFTQKKFFEKGSLLSTTWSKTSQRR